MSTLNPNLIPFWYVFTSSAIGASGSAIGSLVLQVDSVFRLEAVLGSSSLDASTDYAPNNFSVQIQDQGSGRYLSSARVPQVLLSGIARLPGYRRVMTDFAPQTTLAFDILNLSSGSSNTVTIVLQGYKIFSPAASS